MGIDLVSLLEHNQNWSPGGMAESTALPRDVVKARLHAQVVRSVQEVSAVRAFRAIVQGRPRSLLSRRGWQALATYRQMRQRLRACPVGPKPGYCAGYLNQVDSILRSKLGSIIAAHFQAEPPADYADVLNQGDALAAWIVEPIQVEGRAAAA
jgi:hypothetical protein